MSVETTIVQNLDSHNKIIAALKLECVYIISEIADRITAVLQNNGTLYLCGNGGSAADAQHIAGEFVGRFRRNRKPLPAVALSTDTSVLTCIGNDYSFKEIFARQVEALVKKDDILWVFSTSGTTKNIIKAIAAAKAEHAFVIAFTGKENSEVEKSADICLCAKSDSTARAQEFHQLAYQNVCRLFQHDREQCHPVLTLSLKPLYLQD